jgi:hypothetical protein
MLARIQARDENRNPLEFHDFSNFHPDVSGFLSDFYDELRGRSIQSTARSTFARLAIISLNNSRRFLTFSNLHIVFEDDCGFFRVSWCLLNAFGVTARLPAFLCA